MTLVTPLDGIVYYGHPVRGRWPFSAAVAKNMRPGGRVQVRTPLITVVQPRPVALRAAVKEKDLALSAPGLAGRAVPAGFPDMKLSVHMVGISAVPMPDGRFDARIRFEGELPDALMPGMTCKVTFVPYMKADAVTIPPRALFDDEADPDRHYVYLVRPGAQPERLDVTVGKRTAKKVEVLEGLAPGDRVRLDRPREGEADGAPASDEKGSAQDAPPPPEEDAPGDGRDE